jgi:glutamine amidotransferase
MPDVTIVDYGVGNLHSLAKALERAGARVRVAVRAEEFAAASALVLPGVGAFGKVMEAVAPYREALVERLTSGVPVLAICIGMQILYRWGEEGGCAGLGLLDGTVRRLPHSRLPHMAWSPVGAAAADPVLDGIGDGTYFYFVHSFAVPAGEATAGVVATALYGAPFVAAVRRGNLVGTQFHPEKSSAAGARWIENWLKTIGNEGVGA